MVLKEKYTMCNSSFKKGWRIGPFSSLLFLAISTRLVFWLKYQDFSSLTSTNVKISAGKPGCLEPLNLAQKGVPSTVIRSVWPKTGPKNTPQASKWLCHCRNNGAPGGLQKSEGWLPKYRYYLRSVAKAFFSGGLQKWLRPCDLHNMCTY